MSDYELEIPGHVAIQEPALHPAIRDVIEELKAASEAHGPMTSAHEGWAVIKEELDELWEEVREKPSMRSRQRLYDEAKQVAAMGIRFMIDMASWDLPENGKGIEDGDHDHTTDKFRGVLCSRCNHGLGLFLDDLELLRRAVAYLEDHDDA